MDKETKHVGTGKLKKGFRLLYMLLAVLISIPAMVFSLILFFQVNLVTVDGSEKYSDEQILEAAQVQAEINLFAVSKDEIRANVIKSFPYVRDVEVERNFPTTLELHIEESVAVATISAEGSWWILDEDGKILESADESIARNYIQIEGLTVIYPIVGQTLTVPEEEEIRLHSLTGVLSTLLNEGMTGDVSWIDLTDTSKIEMDYMGRFIVELALLSTYDTESQMDVVYGQKCKVLVKIVELLSTTDSGTIDLRYDDGYFRPN